jgi:hypothetical protein
MATAACWCPVADGIRHDWNPEAGCPDSGPTRGGFVAGFYEGGGHREENGARPRFDLLWTRTQPLERQMLYRDAVWYQKGAAKYGVRNWESFCTQDALERAEASLGRHYAAFVAGLTDEDHAAAIRANVQFIEYIRERIAAHDAAGEGTY